VAIGIERLGSRSSIDIEGRSLDDTIAPPDA
jgi:hypothetical protein